MWSDPVGLLCGQEVRQLEHPSKSGVHVPCTNDEDEMSDTHEQINAESTNTASEQATHAPVDIGRGGF